MKNYQAKKKSGARYNFAKIQENKDTLAQSLD